MKKLLLALLAFLPLSASAAAYERVDYETCAFDSRDTGEMVVRGFRCGSDWYGDCSFVNFTYSSVGQARSMRCPDVFVSQIWFAQAGSDFNTGSGYYLPTVPSQLHYHYPNPQTLTGVTVFRMDVSPVSVTLSLSGSQADPPPEAVPLLYENGGVTYYHPDSLSFAAVLVTVTILLFATLVLIAKAMFEAGNWLAGKRKKQNK